MDRSWTKLKNRFSSSYKEGVEQFLQVAFEHLKTKHAALDQVNLDEKIKCPCQRCINCFWKTRSEVKTDLFVNGILEHYTVWDQHGEPSHYNSQTQEIDETQAEYLTVDTEEECNDIPNILEDLQRASMGATNVEEMFNNSDIPIENEEAEKFSRLLNDAKSELYPGCKYSKLSFIIKLLHNKTITNSSNKAFDINLKLIKDALPEGETLPSSYYEVKKMLRDLGLGYTKIDACPNDCILFRKEFKSLDKCPNCQASRWQNSSGEGSKVAEKVLRYFPLKPRLQRLFACKDIAEDMRWHKEKRVDDDFIRHPADAKSWKAFDEDHSWFARDPRNVRLGLASDGFNPFGNMNNSHSMWPVFIIPYNLPPWRCTKEPFIFMSLLIPGKKSPGNNIDVYMQPLVDELNELWVEGIQTYDAFAGESFKLHVALLWTINDFPAYAMLSGWSTKGKLACPICNKDTDSITLQYGRKQSYMGSRRFLCPKHSWRKSKKFNGKSEYRLRPKCLSGDDVLEQLANLDSNSRHGKKSNNRKRKRPESELNWTKKSIFFELPYWRSLNLRHNLDVMHIEKNIGENILCTLLSVAGKTKDDVNSRYDLEAMGIKKELHVRKEGNKVLIPQACYSLTSTERKKFGQWWKSIKLPDGFGSNISRCVDDEGKVSGMKSHDYHVFLQRLLPVVAHNFLRKDVFIALSELSDFYSQLCSKTLHRAKLDQLKKDAVLILCKLETIYPPSFFVIMVHLTIHLADEVELGGPVQYRWMYFIERLLKTLKNFVRNRARPEGSIAEAFLDKECLNFCSMYFSDVETKFNRQDRNNDGGVMDLSPGFSIFKQQARPLGAAKYDVLLDSDYEKIQWYVLLNCDEISSYLSSHKEELERENPMYVEKRHQAQFASWLKERVVHMKTNGLIGEEDPLFNLGLGPNKRIIRYGGIIVNGVRFHTREHDKGLVTQNSGIMVKGEHDSKDIDFYGVLTDIIELQYNNFNRVFIFKCDWWNVGDKKNGLKTYGRLISVNTSRKWYEDDPFILATQAELVFYVPDIKNGGGWQIIQKGYCRSLYDVPSRCESVNEEQTQSNEPYQQDQANESTGIGVIVDLSEYVLSRADTLPQQLDTTVIQSRQNNIGFFNNEDDDDDDDDDDDTIAEYYDDSSERSVAKTS